MTILNSLLEILCYKGIKSEVAPKREVPYFPCRAKASKVRLHRPGL